MTRIHLLSVAYVANILILVPICWSMLMGAGTSAVFEGKAADSPGLRLLVGSLWFAILAASAAGIIWPRFFAPVLMIQIVYKGLWLAVFIMPLMLAGKTQMIPWGIAITFALIVASYPWLFWFSGVLREGQ